MREDYGVIPGSTKERKIIYRVVDSLKETLEQVDLVDIPVNFWSSDCSINVGSDVNRCILLPYSSPIYLKVTPEEILFGRPNEIFRVKVRDKAILIDYPTNLTELRWITFLLSLRGAKAVLLSPELEGTLKSDVVLGSIGYTNYPTVPLNIPVACVDRKTARIVAEKGFELEARSEITMKESKIVVGHLNGSGELEAHLTSHHDVLVGEFEDTPSSVLLSVIRRLRETYLPLNLTVISYTAREIGDAEFTEYHYTWGERYLLRVMSSKGALDKVVLSASVGPIHSSRDLKIVSHPVFSKYLSTELNLSEDHSFLESHFYLQRGIPSLTITSLPNTWMFHNSTSFHVVDKANIEAQITSTILQVLKSAEFVNDWISDLRKNVIKSIGEQSLETRVETSKLISLSANVSPIKVVKEVTKLSYSLIYAMCSNPLKTWVKSSLFSSISGRTAETLNEYVKNCLGELVIGDSKRSNFFLLGRTTSDNRDRLLNLYLRSIIMDLKSSINTSIAGAKLLGVASGGIEEWLEDKPV